MILKFALLYATLSAACFVYGSATTFEGISDGQLNNRTARFTPVSNKAARKSVVAANMSPPKREERSVKQSLLQRSPLTFVENRGQFNPYVKFRAQSGNRLIWFTNKGLVFDVIGSTETLQSLKGSSIRAVVMGAKPLVSQQSSPDRMPGTLERQQRLVFSETFVEGSETPELEASQARIGIHSYFIGNDPRKWQTGLAGYSRLVYHNVWPGIDIRFVANGADVEQEFLVRPGADASKIHVEYAGVDGLQTAVDGSLIVHTIFGPMRESSPRLYQEVLGKRNEVKGRYLVSDNHSYTFQLGPYQKNKDLVIDPTLLFSTYIGGGGVDASTGIAVDASGNSYLVGSSAVQGVPYPTTAGAFQTLPPNLYNCGAVVSKFDPAGNLAYSTFLASTGGCVSARGIALDALGEAYVTGVGSPGFPTTINAFPSPCGASSFVSKLNSTGTALIYSACLVDEGYAAEYGVGANAIAVDKSGRAYLTGSTSSTAFPVTGDAYQQALAGFTSAFLLVVDPVLSGTASLVYSTHLGGEIQDFGQSIAVDPAGAAYITGYTSSAHFPVTLNASQPIDKQRTCNNGTPTSPQCVTGFVAKLDPKSPGAAGLVYSTYLGGTVGNTGVQGVESSGDYPSAIAVDSSGNAYVGGSTQSDNFPTTTGAVQSSPSCTVTQTIGFVTKLNSSGSALTYSTFLGALNQSGAACTTSIAALALDSSNNAYVAGYTRSAGFPVTSDALQAANHNGLYTAFLTEISASGSDLIYSTYLGGSGFDNATGEALDAAGDIYLTGTTSSIDFPVTAFAFQRSLTANPACQQNGYSCSDIFVAKFEQGSSGCATDVSQQISIVRSGFHLNHTTHSFAQTITLTNSGSSLSGLSLVLDGLGSNATLIGSGGTTKCAAPIGSPWISIPGTLATGQSVSLAIAFSDPTQANIQYSTRVLAGTGQQ